MVSQAFYIWFQTKDIIRFLFWKEQSIRTQKMAVSHELSGDDNEMRKIIIIGILTIVLIAVIGLVNAGYRPNNDNGDGSKFGFIDEDGDGICDNWIDEDNDGKNDNCPMDGSGKQYKYGQGQFLGKRNGLRNCQE